MVTLSATTWPQTADHLNLNTFPDTALQGTKSFYFISVRIFSRSSVPYWFFPCSLRNIRCCKVAFIGVPGIISVKRFPISKFHLAPTGYETAASKTCICPDVILIIRAIFFWSLNKTFKTDLPAYQQLLNAVMNKRIKQCTIHFFNCLWTSMFSDPTQRPQPLINIGETCAICCF